MRTVGKSGRKGEAALGVRENKESIPVWEKFTLTISEASEYFNIGEKKMRFLADAFRDYGFVLQNGNKVLIKRKKFEDFINETNSV